MPRSRFELSRFLMYFPRTPFKMDATRDSNIFLLYNQAAGMKQYSFYWQELLFKAPWKQDELSNIVYKLAQALSCKKCVDIYVKRWSRSNLPQSRSWIFPLSLQSRNVGQICYVDIRLLESKSILLNIEMNPDSKQSIACRNLQK